MDANLKRKAEQLATQAHTLDDLNGLFRSLMKSTLERMLDTERDFHLKRPSLPALSDNNTPTPTLPVPKNAATATFRRRSAARGANSPSTRPATASAPSSRS